MPWLVAHRSQPQGQWVEAEPCYGPAAAEAEALWVRQPMGQVALLSLLRCVSGLPTSSQLQWDV